MGLNRPMAPTQQPGRSVTELPEGPHKIERRRQDQYCVQQFHLRLYARSSGRTHMS